MDDLLDEKGWNPHFFPEQHPVHSFWSLCIVSLLKETVQQKMDAAMVMLAIGFSAHLFEPQC